MRKIKYPELSAMAKEEMAYKQLFSSHFVRFQQRWEPIRDKLRLVSSNASAYLDNAEDYLCMPFDFLVEMFLDYMHYETQLSDEDKKQLDAIFSYGGYQPQIANFFMNRADVFGVSVCHYCEMSYVNMYGFDTTYSSVAKMLTQADEGELRDYIRRTDGEQYIRRKYQRILALRNRYTEDTIITAFDKMFNGKKKKSTQIELMKFNHFDLDHFLPKSLCPIVGLSLYNLVPSCSVCNEKLKRAKLLGGMDKAKLVKLSPTSNEYDFDGNVTIKIVPEADANLLRMSHSPDKYRLVFCPETSVYQDEVQLFRLSARYNYHKTKALRLHDKLIDYPSSMIEKIKELFDGSRTKEEIEQDIYGAAEEKDTFAKLTRDVLYAYKK